MNRDTFESGIQMISSVFPKDKPTKEGLALYWMVLNRLSDTQFMAALERGAKSWKFFPKPAEIWQEAEVAMRAPVECSLPTVECAWTEVLSAARSYSPYKPLPAWSHKIVTEACKSIGGLEALAYGEQDQTPFIRSQFYKSFEALQKRHVSKAVDLMLGGTDAIGVLQEAYVLPGRINIVGED